MQPVLATTDKGWDFRVAGRGEVCHNKVGSGKSDRACSTPTHSFSEKCLVQSWALVKWNM